MKRKLMVSVLSCLLLAGCVPTHIIDDILIVEAEGFDYIGHNKVIGTVTMPNFVQSGNQGGQGAGLPTTASLIRSLSVQTYNGKSLVDRLQSEGQVAIQAGKIRLMLFNLQMAKHGLSIQMSFRNRDPDVPRDLTLAVVDGSCKKLLTATDYQTQIPVSRYAQDMIMQNNTQNYPDSDLSTFLYAYYGAYMDPFMPIIKKNGDHLEMKGLALFNHDKYVMRIPDSKVFVFKMLYQNFTLGVYDLEYQPGRHIALRNVKTSVSYKVRHGNSTSPDIYAMIHIIGQVRQAYPGSVSKEKTPQVAKEMEEGLASDARRLVRKFQKKGTDPLQLGDKVRSFTYNFDGKSWPERYHHARFHCKVSVIVQQTGIAD